MFNRFLPPVTKTTGTTILLLLLLKSNIVNAVACPIGEFDSPCTRCGAGTSTPANPTSIPVEWENKVDRIFDHTYLGTKAVYGVGNEGVKMSPDGNTLAYHFAGAPDWGGGSYVGTDAPYIKLYERANKASAWVLKRTFDVLTIACQPLGTCTGIKTADRMAASQIVVLTDNYLVISG